MFAGIRTRQSTTLQFSKSYHVVRDAPNSRFNLEGKNRIFLYVDDHDKKTIL